MKYFPESPMAKLFVSRKVVGNINAEKPELLHQIGTTHTPLRPSGTAVINGKRVDVVTEGGMIERGTPIKVVAIEGMRVVVRGISPAELSQTGQMTDSTKNEQNQKT
jgi:membrane-bound ClpP family serine protease